MYYLRELCCICLTNKGKLIHICNFNSDFTTYYSKLTSAIPEMCFVELNETPFVCEECCRAIDAIYEFRNKCLRNKSILQKYVKTLQSVSWVSGQTSVLLADIGQTLRNAPLLTTSPEFLTTCEDAKTDDKIKSSITVERPDEPVPVKCENEEGNNNEDAVIMVQYEPGSYIITTGDLINDAVQNCIPLLMTNESPENESAVVCESGTINDWESNSGTELNEDEDLEDINILTESNPYIVTSGIIISNEINNTEENNTNEDILSSVPSEFLNGSKQFDISDRAIQDCYENKDEVISSSIELIEDEDFENEEPSREQSPYIVTSGIIISDEINKMEEIDTNENVLNSVPSEIVNDNEQFNISDRAIQDYYENKDDGTTNSINSTIQSYKPTYICGVCNKKFNTKIKFNIHLKEHKENKCLECHKCNKTYVSVQSLMSHLKTHMSDISCNVCHKTLAFEHYLYEHMTMHNGEEAYQCQKCDRKFCTKRQLRWHKRSHSDQQTFN